MLSDDETLAMEHRARRFSGAWTGTSGTLAADVIRLLKERRQLLGMLPAAATGPLKPTTDEAPAGGSFWGRLSRLFGRKEFGAKRSSQWRKVRQEHLKRQPACQACGRDKSLEVHHIKPFHKHPELELEPTNLMTLCADPCHIVHGHLMSWRRDNPDAEADCAAYFSKIEGSTSHG